MTSPDAVVTAVFRTLLRATADAGTTVVLRAGGAVQARAVAQWLEHMHGSRRTVIASRSGRADVELRLPARLAWQACVPPAQS